MTLYTLITLLLFRVLAPTRTLSNFSGSIIVVVMNLFIMKKTVFRAKLTGVVDSHVLGLTKGDRLHLFVLIVLIASYVKTFIDGANAITLVLPVMIDLTTDTGVGTDHLLVPLTFTDDLNVVALVTAPPGLVVRGALVRTNFRNLSFFSFLPINLVTAFVNVVMLLPLDGVFLSGGGSDGGSGNGFKGSLGRLIRRCKLSSGLFHVGVPSGSSLGNGAVVRLSVQQGCDLGMLRIQGNGASRRHFLGAIARGVTSPRAILRRSSVLCVGKGLRRIGYLVTSFRLRLLSRGPSRGGTGAKGSLSFCSVNVTRVMLVPTSHVVKRDVGRANFHSGFGMGVLKVHHGGRCLLRSLTSVHVRPNSMLLVRKA